MAGLLGLPDDEELALAAGLLSGGWGGGATAWLNAKRYAQEKNSPEAKLRLGLLSAQTDETRAQGEERRAKTELARRAQERQDRFLNGDGPQGLPPSAFMPAGDGMGPALAPGSAPSSGGLLGIARNMGIPEHAIQADVAFNGGKGISDMLFKRGTPDMQVSNGFAYDKNALGAGFMPFLNTSQSGQTSMGRIGPDGLPVVSAPRGAMETYRGYQDADQQTKANYDPLTIPPRAGQTNPTLTTRGAFIRDQQPAGGAYGTEAGLRGAAAGPMGADPAALRREIDATVRDLTTKQLDPSSRQQLEQHLAGLSATLRQVGGPSGVQGISLQSEPEKTMANDLAKGEAERKNAELSKGSQFKDFRDQLKMARTLLEAGPTNSLVGAGVDSALGAVGVSTPGANIARQLETAQKWLTQNIPKAPGAQSDAELKEYAGATGIVGDRTIPVDQRLAALKTAEGMLDKWEKSRAGGQQTQAAPPAPTAGMVRNGYRFKGGNPADPKSWEKM